MNCYVKHRNLILISKRVRIAEPQSAHTGPDYGMCVIRCQGSKSPEQASLENVRTCFQHVLGSRGGHTRISYEAVVMTVERRGMDHRSENVTTKTIGR